MMKKHLLPQVERYFKTNLHTHSTISDGGNSPEQVKQIYKELGYQVLAITDHNIIVDHSALNDNDFLMLTGTEINFNGVFPNGLLDNPTYHMNLIAKRPDNLWFPGSPSEKFPHAQAYKDKMEYENMSTDYSPELVNAMIAKANEMGFLVTYNHPVWSCQSYPDYAPLKGLWGMELCNGECCLGGLNDNNARVFKDLLNLGNRIYPLGADDMHWREAAGLAWIMAGAERLEYGSVIEALEKGDFYMSCGPEITELSVEGNMLKIACSDARQITLETHGRWAKRASAIDENWLHHAEFDLTNFCSRSEGKPSAYVYLTVTAPDGTYATTRAYYIDELKA